MSDYVHKVYYQSKAQIQRLNKEENPFEKKQKNNRSIFHLSLMNPSPVQYSQQTSAQIHQLLRNPSLILTHISAIPFSNSMSHKHIEPVINMIKEVEKTSKIKVYDLLMVIVRKVWKFIEEMNKIRLENGWPLAKSKLASIEHLLNFLWQCLLLSKSIILDQGYFVENLFTALFVPIIKRLASTNLFEDDFIRSFLKDQSSNVQMHSKLSISQKSKVKLSSYRESELPQNSKVIEQNDKTAQNKESFKRMDALRHLIKDFSFQFIVWMGINFPLHRYNTNMSTSSIFCIQFHRFTQYQQKPQSFQHSNHSLSTQKSQYHKIMTQGFQYFTLEDKIQYEKKLSLIDKLPHSTISKTLISFYLQFWLGYFLLDASKLSQKKPTKYNSVKSSSQKSEHSSKAASLTQQDALQIQLGVREYAFGQIISTRDYMLIEVGLQTLFEGFFVLHPQTKVKTRYDYPNQYGIKRQVVIKRILRLMTTIIFTGQIQAISRINDSKVLLKLFNFVFAQHRHQIKEKYGHADSELQKQFIALLGLLKHATKGIKLSTVVHQAMMDKILIVYTKYEVDEILDEYGYGFGHRMSASGSHNESSCKVLNFEQLLQYVSRQKIEPFQQYTQQKFTYFVFDIQQQATLTKISQTSIPKLTSQVLVLRKGPKQKVSSFQTNQLEVSYGNGKSNCQQQDDSWNCDSESVYRIQQHAWVEGKANVREDELMVDSKLKDNAQKYGKTRQSHLASNILKPNPSKSLKPSPSSLLKLTIPSPTNKTLKSQISFMPGQFPLTPMFQIPQQSRQYTSRNHSHEITPQSEQSQEELLRQYKLQRRKKQIEKTVTDIVARKIVYHKKILAQLQKMENQKKQKLVQEQNKLKRALIKDDSDANSMLQSVSGSSYDNSSQMSKWKAIMKKKKSKRSQFKNGDTKQLPDNFASNLPYQSNQISPQSSPNYASGLVQTAKFSPLVETARFYQNSNNNVSNHQILNQSNRMRQTGIFFRSKKEMEYSKKSQHNNTIQKMQNSLENLKVDLMQKNVNLVDSKHTVMKDSNHQQRMFISSFQVTKSKESEYFKQTNRAQLPLIREEQLIKIESIANDPEAKGPNSIKNDRTNNAKDSKYKDRYFTVQELVYLENLEKQKQKNQHYDRIGQMSPQKKQQAKQYVKENIKQIYQKNQLLLIEKQLADEQKRKKNHKNYLAIGSNFQLKLSKSVDNLKEDIHQVIIPKNKRFQKLTSLHLSPQKYHIKEKNGPMTQAKDKQLMFGPSESLNLSPIVPLNIKQLQNPHKAKTLLFSNDFMQVGWLKKPSIGRFQQCHLVITINLSHQANEKMRKLIKSERQEDRNVSKISIVVEIISVAFDICTHKDLSEQTQKMSTIFTKKYPIKDLSQNSRRAKNHLNASQCQFSVGFIHNLVNGQLSEGSRNKGKFNQNQTEVITPKNKNQNIQQLEVISCVSKLSLKDSIIPDLFAKNNNMQTNRQCERKFTQNKSYKVIIRLEEQKPLNSPKISSHEQPSKYIKISDYPSTLSQQYFKLSQAKIPLFQPYFTTNLCQQNIALSVLWNYGLLNSNDKATKIKQKDVEAKSISYHAISSQWHPLRLQFTTVVNKNSPKSKLSIYANQIPDISIKCPQLLQSLLVHHCDNMKSEKERSPQNQTYTINTHGNVNIQGDSQVQCYWQDDNFCDMKKEALKQEQPKQETEKNQVQIFLSSISIHWHLTVITRNANQKEQKQLYRSAQKGQKTIKQFKIQLQSSIQQSPNSKNSIILLENSIFKSLFNLQHLKSLSLKVMQHFQRIFCQP